MSQISEPVYTVDVYVSKGVIHMMCYEDGCEFDVDMDLYRAHMGKDGKWTVHRKRE